MVRRVSVIDSNISYNVESKTAVSVRDGVIEYLGAEIGAEPPERIFTVYRSPATIANVASAMQGIPVTDEHVEVGEPVMAPIGSVNKSKMIDMIDSSVGATLAIENKVSLKDAFTVLLDTGKRELSLGYEADLVPHDKYDFEQRNIVPHHLAIVLSGRCGSACRFTDRKPTHEDSSMKQKPLSAAMAKIFCDQEGAVSLEQVVEIAMALPDAIKKVPVDKLQEIMPSLLEIIGYAKSNGVEMPEEEGAKTEVTDEDPKKVDEEKDKIPVTDSKEFIDALKKATDTAVKLHSEVVDKARQFVDESYSFVGKATNEVMRDALATEHGSTKFSDAELPVAFKLLKKTANYQKFGDSKDGGLESRIKSSLEGK